MITPFAPFPPVFEDEFIPPPPPPPAPYVVAFCPLFGPLLPWPPVPPKPLFPALAP